MQVKDSDIPSRSEVELAQMVGQVAKAGKISVGDFTVYAIGSNVYSEDGDLITLETVEIGLSEVVYHRRTRKYHQQ